MAESFVDSQLFRGTCHKAQGWTLLGLTKGNQRVREDFYVGHERPKQLWMRELTKGAGETLRSDSLPTERQHVEDAVAPKTDLSSKELRKLYELCTAVPEWRKRKGRDYPLPCLLAFMVMASLSGVDLGQRDLAGFASGLTQGQLRALRSYRRNGRYEYPKESTFQRVLANVDARAFEKVLNDWRNRYFKRVNRDGLEKDDQIAFDGRAPRGSDPEAKNECKPQLVSVLSLPSGQTIGTVIVGEKNQ